MAVSDSTDRFNGVVASKAIKVPCKVATSVNITLSGAQNIDGVNVVSGDRVLVRAQTNAVENGIYCVGSAAWSRAADWDGNRDITQGTLVYALDSIGNLTPYQVDTPDPITIGSTAVTITAFVSAGAVIEAGTQVNAIARWDGIDTWREAERVRVTANGAEFQMYEVTETTFMQQTYVGTEFIFSISNPAHTFRFDNDVNIQGDVVITGGDLIVTGGGTLSGLGLLIPFDTPIEWQDDTTPTPLEIEHLIFTGAVPGGTPTPDPNIGSVTLLISGETAAVGATNFQPDITQGSSWEWEIYAGGPPDVDGEIRAFSQFGNKSVYHLESSGIPNAGWDQISDDGTGNFGSSDFTIELDFYLAPNQVGAGTLLGKWLFGQRCWTITFDSSNRVGLQISTTGSNSIALHQQEGLSGGSASIPLGQWVNLIVQRSGNNWDMWLNGDQTQDGTIVNSSTLFNSTSRLHGFGADQPDVGSGNTEFYMENVRITEGVARYVSGMDPVTPDPRPFDGSTSVLKFVVGDPAYDTEIDGATILIGGDVTLDTGRLFLDERGTNGGNIFDGRGQIWVRNDTPNVLMFTDDAGNDVNISDGVLPASTVLDAILHSDGAGGWNEETQVRVTNGGALEIYNVAENQSVSFNHDDEHLQIVNTNGGLQFFDQTETGTDPAFELQTGDMFLRSDSTAAPTAGNAPQYLIQWLNRTGVVAATVGPEAADEHWYHRYSVESGAVITRVTRQGAPGVETTGLIVNPHGNSAVLGETGGVVLFYQEQFLAGFAAARTDTVANGVLMVNTDGAGTWERVLTLSDLGSVTFPLDADDNEQIRMGTGQDALIFFDATNFRIDMAAGGIILDAASGGDILLQENGTTRVQLDNSNDRLVLNDYTLFMEERAAALADVAGYGQLWVRNDSPNVLVFTDDTGVDTVLGAGGGTISGSIADNQVAVGDGADSIEGTSRLTWNDLTLLINAEANSITSLNIGESSTLRGNNADGRILLFGEQGGAITTATIQNTGSNFQFAAAANNSVQFSGSGTWEVQVRDGATFRIFDSSDTDSLAIRHDGADVLITTVNTGEIQIAETGTRVRLPSTTDASLVSTDHPFQIGADGGDNLRMDRNEIIAADNGAVGTLGLQAEGGVINMFTNTAGTVSVRTGSTFQIESASNGDEAAFSHDDTDFISAFTNTVDWNVTGITRFKVNGVVTLQERSSAPSDEATYGQFWVEDEAPCVPRFTDDDGDDFHLDGRSEINTQNGNYTLVMGDKGKTIYKASGGAGETWTIPANGTVAFPIGTLISFDNDGGGDLTIAITTDTLVGTDGTTGSRTLGDNHTAVIQKLTATRWRYAASDL